MDGWGFGRGSRAWVVVGDARNLVALPVLSESGSSLRLDTSVVDADRADLVVLTAGRQLSVIDVMGAAIPVGSGVRVLAPGAGACGCVHGDATGSTGIALVLVALAWRRRPTVVPRPRGAVAGAAGDRLSSTPPSGPARRRRWSA